MTWEYVGLVALIFAARCTDVTMGVFRILMLVQGRRFIAAILGFFEVMVFLLTMGLILGGGKSLNAVELIAYCGGFAAGNLVGTYLERKLMDAYVMVEIVAERNESGSALITALREAGFGTTVLVGEGRSGVRLVIKVICSRRHVTRTAEMVSKYGGFLIVSDIRGVSGGFFTRGGNIKRK